MLQNYFKTAWRYLVKHKFYSVIHVLCLALGITFAMVIGIYVLNQYAVNRSLKSVDHQYLIKSDWGEAEGGGLDITTLGPLAKTVYEEYPSLVANFYRYNPVTNVVSAGENHFMENIAIGDTTLVNMYGFPVLYGDKQHPFTDNHSAVITESVAIKLFGKKDATDETISIHTTVNGVKQDYVVSAVIADLPYNSVTRLTGDVLTIFVPAAGSLYYGSGEPLSNWNNPFEIGLIQLQPGVVPADLTRPFRQILATHTPENIQQNLTVELAALKDYYLNDNNGAARKMIIILSASALFILLMAIINFVNISVGTAATRLKEIGLRKVFGGAKKQLVAQFLGEALLLTAFAATLSLPLYEVLRPVFDEILNTQLTSVFHFGWGPVCFLTALVALTGLAAGIYPAFVLSTANMVVAVKGKIDTTKGGLSLRKSMLTVQFTLAIAAFIGALTVSRQVRFIFAKDIGYDKDQVMVITAFPKQWDDEGVHKMMAVQQDLLQLTSVKDATLSFEVPNRQPPNAFSLQVATGEGPKAPIISMGADEHYASTFGMTMLTGSCFAQSGGYIPGQIVLNESAVNALGLTVESAVNQKIRDVASGNEVIIAGVVKDFNYSSLQEQIEPIAFFHVRDFRSYRYLSLKLNTTDMANTVALIKNQWNELLPNSPFEFTFMDEQFASLYRSEMQLKRAADVATVLNFVIVFMGIFGMVTFTLNKRMKEIAVRKVLGARIRHITLLFIKDYAWLIVLATAIAWPLTYLAADKWLASYAYRINQDAGLYIAVAVIIFAAACSLITVLCVRAGRANPVDSLRDE
ncbi:FtsX-like permease family protein [Parapedobacter deserti]|uniref:FtsX-like permease family protein n=1 Tax=Parapedobacter deserti TaxID=1912957 RepID=A0ABV7JDD0_9SPHI